jgi:hypothetical protein
MSNGISKKRSLERAIAQSGRLDRTGNASSQALAARRVEVRDANTTVELR